MLTILVAVLAASLSATPEPAGGAGESAIEPIKVRPNRAPLTIAISVTSDDGDDAAAASTATVLRDALHLSPPFDVSPTSGPVARKLVLSLRRTASGMRGHVVVTAADGSRVLEETWDGPHRPRELGLRVADRLRAIELGMGPVFSTRLAAIQRGQDGERHLVTMDPLGGDLRAPRRDGLAVAAPAWSADGRTLYFTSWRAHPEIWSLDVATGAARRVIAMGTQSTNAAPAPRGGSVVFSAHAEGNADLYRIDAGTPGPVRLTVSPATDTQPSWNRSTDEIVFRSGRSGGSHLFSLSARGGEAQRLTFESGTEYVDPAVHPLGDRVATAARTRGGSFQVRILAFRAGPGGKRSLDEQRPVVLAPAAGCEGGEPSWSPEGELVVFTETCRAEPHLVVSTPDGSRRVRLPVDGLESPAWGPVAPGTTAVADRRRG